MTLLKSMNAPRLRQLTASLLSVAAFVAFGWGVGHEWHFLVVPLSLLLLSAGLVHRAALGPQLLSRAVWWANLALGTMLALDGSSREKTTGMLLALTTGAALLVSGRKALGEASSAAGYVPAALKSTLMLLMIFALADAQTFLLFGSVGIIDGSATKFPHVVTLVTIGLGYVVGFVGLYRLRIWGALLDAGLSVLVLVLLFAIDLIGRDSIRTFMAILAVVHVLVAAPVGLSALGRVRLPTMAPRLRGVLATVVIALLMATSFLVWSLHHAPAQIDY